ncbi:MAG: GHKL domain-containing protein, partial [Bacteroidetes bacterium]|nr:GHKL domain-containing protein [Bacteroidota bacterium]
SKSETRTIPVGDHLFQNGVDADYLLIVLSGNYMIYIDRQGKRREISDMPAGNITGVLPYSRMVKAGGNAQCIEESEVIFVHRDHFPEMIKEHYELTQAFVHVMTNRIRRFSVLQSQNEKLMSLGKLSAGLAHELNNPASAIVRSSDTLRSHLKAQPEKFKRTIKIKMTEEQIDAINDVVFNKIDGHKASCLSLMARTDIEDELTDWLEDHGIEDAYEIVENLVEFGFTVEELDDILDSTGPEHLAPVIHWIESNLSIEKMVEEIQDASHRISELVKSIKSYTHMDQSGDRKPIDVHDGLRSTCIMLKHKFNKSQTELVETFAENLPKVKALPGELNQVWTNIIDNALDVLDDVENSKLTISTRQDREFVRVSIIDNGPGIPNDILNRIFDPFFTTKELGKGTGLGLDVALKIVQQHNGDIKVRTEPGRTEFEICLPVE